MRQPAVAAKGAISPPPNHAQFLFIAVRVKPYASSDSGWATTERPRPGTRPVTLRCVQRLSTEHMAQAAIWRQRQQQRSPGCNMLSQRGSGCVAPAYHDVGRTGIEAAAIHGFQLHIADPGRAGLLCEFRIDLKR